MVLLLLLVTAAGYYQGIRSVVRTEVEVVDTISEPDFPYQAVFERCAPQIGWPWELLAALAWTESHLNPLAHSEAGARGLMQMMPATGEKFGLNDSTCWIAECSIEAATIYLAKLENRYDCIADSTERWKFVVAAYNSGPGTITMARNAASRLELDPDKWDNIERFVPSDETRRHVKKIEEKYLEIKNN